MDTLALRRIAVVLGIIAVVVLAVTGIVRLATGGGDEADPVQTEIDLLDYETADSSVRLTYEGEIVAREDYREIRFVISPTMRRVEVVRGYNGNVIERETLRNDLASYEVFLRALDYEGFDQFQDNERGEDHRGVCPTGNRTIAELYDDGTRQFKLWSASCDRDAGTLEANDRRLRRLFEDQIPNYRDITRGVRL